MSFTEKKVIDKIEILENGAIQIRESYIIEKDGIEIARNFTRWSLCPGDNIDNQEQRIKDIAKLLWTEEVIKNYKDSLKPLNNINSIPT